MVSTWEPKKTKQNTQNPVRNYTMTASGKANQKTWLQRLRWQQPCLNALPRLAVHNPPCPGVRHDLANGAVFIYILLPYYRYMLPKVFEFFDKVVDT